MDIIFGRKVVVCPTQMLSMDLVLFIKIIVRNTYNSWANQYGNPSYSLDW
jgi:hypothetical protein